MILGDVPVMARRRSSALLTLDAAAAVSIQRSRAKEPTDASTRRPSAEGCCRAVLGPLLQHWDLILNDPLRVTPNNGKYEKFINCQKNVFCDFPQFFPRFLNFYEKMKSSICDNFEKENCMLFV